MPKCMQLASYYRTQKARVYFYMPVTFGNDSERKDTPFVSRTGTE